MFSNLILLLFVSKLFNDARTSSFFVKAKLFCPEIAGLFWHRYIIKGKREVPFLVERHLSST